VERRSGRQRRRFFRAERGQWGKRILRIPQRGADVGFNGAPARSGDAGHAAAGETSASSSTSGDGLVAADCPCGTAARKGVERERFDHNHTFAEVAGLQARGGILPAVLELGR